MRKRRRGAKRHINPDHESKRMVLRVIGLALLLAGALTVISALGLNHEPKTEFFAMPGKHMKETRELSTRKQSRMIFGMIMAIAGIALTSFAFQGAIARFKAAEVAPVASATARYVKPAIREVAQAVAEGVRGESGGATCPKCEADNDADAKFCDECGAKIAAACSSCGKQNDADAKFCDGCGNRL